MTEKLNKPAARPVTRLAQSEQTLIPDMPSGLLARYHKSRRLYRRGELSSWDRGVDCNGSSREIDVNLGIRSYALDRFLNSSDASSARHSVHLELHRITLSSWSASRWGLPRWKGQEREDGPGVLDLPMVGTPI
jgi:hypothetical protein